MKQYHIARLVMSILLMTGVNPVIAAQDGLSLFSEEDAQTLRIEGDAWDTVPRARGATLGPVIVVEVPRVTRVDGGEAIVTMSPTSMTVVFEENEAPVNMSSLDISAKKGVFSKSLTEMMAPYVEGTTLAVENLTVPSGKYQIQIVVEDLEGHETKRTYRLIVAE